MSGILFLAVVALGIMLLGQRKQLRELQDRVDRLDRAPRPHTLATPPSAPLAAEPDAAPPRTERPRTEPLSPERAEAAPDPDLVSSPDPRPAQPWRAAPAPPAMASPVPEPTPRPSLETLIGARLPVWIGAIALVAAGFFLVRYSIEVGLLGPGVRTVLAALFAALLIAGSEVVRRLPATRDDPRMAQALAGAGIASSYATLYIAAALYHFISPLPAFGLMVAITTLGLALSLRHGAPTAILALGGGFVAPLVAGYDAAGVAPLLVYLALFTAALFALAIHRGWAWLAIAATVAAFGWVNFLLFVLAGQELAAPAAFVVLLAIGASLALPRAGVANAWLRLAPLVAGLVQLLAFAPALDFSPLAWSFYLVLAAASLFLAWRDDRYLPGALAALGLTLVLLALGLSLPDIGATHLAAIAATAIFAVPGLILLPRARGWAVLAIGGLAGPVLLANLLDSALLADWQWAGIELAAAALAAWASWRRRAAIDTRDPGLVGGTLAAATLAAAALGQLAGSDWLPLPLAVIAVAIGAWARRTGDGTLLRLPALALAIALLAAFRPLSDYFAMVIDSASGAKLTYPLLPPLADSLRQILPPLAAAVGLLLFDRRLFGRLRPAALIVAIVLGLFLLHHLAKLPLAIADDARFFQWGFVERAFITHALFAAGWLLLRRAGLAAAGIYLFGLALARLVWFDLTLLNPAFVAQHVGGLPLLNAAVLHLALAALWCWTFAVDRPWRILGMAFTLTAVAAAVRQATHGTLLTGPITTSENYWYSLAFLLLALAWLALGIRRDARDLRIAGLALLTFITFKVFLIDAAALDGLLRVVSFLGLGVALIGLSWTYTRFLARPKASVVSG